MTTWYRCYLTCRHPACRACGDSYLTNRSTLVTADSPKGAGAKATAEFTLTKLSNRCRMCHRRIALKHMTVQEVDAS